MNMKRTNSEVSDDSVVSESTASPVYKKVINYHSPEINTTQRIVQVMSTQDSEVKPSWAQEILEKMAQMSQDMSQVRTSLENLESKMSSTQVTANIAQTKVTQLTTSVDSLKEENRILKEKILTGEKYSRKNNLIFTNIPQTVTGDDKEGPEHLIDKVNVILQKVGLSLVKPQIDNIHRLPGPPNRPKPVIVKFVSYLDRSAIWDLKKEIIEKNSNSHIIVKEHFPPEIEKNIQQLNKIRMAARCQGLKARLDSDVLVVESKKYRIKDLHLLPEELQPDNLTYRKVDNFLFFFGRECCLSNFAESNFSYSGSDFSCSEQFIQFSKAKFFGDDSTAAKVMLADNPVQMKKLGHRVTGYDEHRFRAFIQSILADALEHKFRQNTEMAKFLVDTGDLTLIEAAPNDNWWGIGRNMFQKNILDTRDTWGENQLGKTLEVVRNRLTNN